MDNQHKMIAGYRDLSKEEILAINAIKHEGKQIEDLIAMLKENCPAHDHRWLDAGIIDLQRGLMALTRSVARPTNF